MVIILAKEIEKKFLVDKKLWQAKTEGMKIAQGYIADNEKCVVRVRIVDEQGFLTVKSSTIGITRDEFEYIIPKEEAQDLLKSLTINPPIEKVRYLEQCGKHVWEVDVFHGVNSGLVLAEIELGSEDEIFEKPLWITRDVSRDSRFFNSNLAKNPYCNFRELDLLDNRLQEIAHQVPIGSKVVDVGTDHAYLPVYLVKNNIAVSAIASDITDGPYMAAQKTVQSFGLGHLIEVRRADGINGLKQDEANVCIVAGMGGSTIIDILSQGKDNLVGVKCLILQPMVGASELRRWLAKNSWQIVQERLAKENSRLYEIIVAEKADIEYEWTEIEYLVGKRLLSERPILFQEHLNSIINKYTRLIESMEKSSQAISSEKYFFCKNLLENLYAINTDN